MRPLDSYRPCRYERTDEIKTERSKWSVCLTSYAFKFINAKERSETKDVYSFNQHSAKAVDLAASYSIISNVTSAI